MDLFSQSAFDCSRVITKSYSTSFSITIRMLSSEFRLPIYGIYGFVRYADEIVDTFHTHDKRYLLDQFTRDTYEAIENKISLNPILHSFQQVVHQHQISHELIDAFLYSMSMDLEQSAYSQQEFEKYVYGSAEAVGLMCLKVFTKGDMELYHSLVEPARSLGAAFQKVNFLRDVKDDYLDRGRLYFPNLDWNAFTSQEKREIEESIAADFEAAYHGISRLPKQARLGVYLAYVYYNKLFKKIRKTPATAIMERRIRVNNGQKAALILSTYLKNQLNFI